MASGTISLGTSNQITGRIKWSSTSNGTSANTSTVTATIQVKRTDSYTTTGTWTGSLKIGGTTKSFSKYKAVSDSWYTLLSFDVTVSHSNDGSGTCAISGTIKGPTDTSQENSKVTSSKTVTLDKIARQATLVSVLSFYDDENLTITYNNPLGNDIALLQVGISSDNTSDCDLAEYKAIDKTANTITRTLTDAERTAIRAVITDKNYRTVWVYLKSQIGSTVYYSSLSTTVTIRNPNPTINPTIVDSNTATVAVTGNSSTLVRYLSNAKVTIGAAAVKGATLISRGVTCGSKSLTADGVINNVETNKFVFTALDSRNNLVTVTKTPTFISYIKPTCDIDNSMPDGNGSMTLTVRGSYYNGSFGSKSNSLTVYYRYKTASASSYSSWNTMTVSTSSSSYTATKALTGLDYQTTYQFEAYAKDALLSTSTATKSIKASPIFDWGENDFKFNVPVYDEFGTNFRNGLAAYNSSGIDPNATLEELILTNHANAPQGSGTFYYIHTMFYSTKSTTAARAQVAYPYNKLGLTYRRYYYSGAWSAWTNSALDAYPVGSYYISANDTSPASLFGGTWHRIENRFLWAAPSTSTLGATAGEMTHTLTVSEMPSHTHKLDLTSTAGTGSYSTEYVAYTKTGGTTYSNSNAVISSGGGAAHNNMPPYVNVAIWRREA